MVLRKENRTHMHDQAQLRFHSYSYCPLDEVDEQLQSEMIQLQGKNALALASVRALEGDVHDADAAVAVAAAAAHAPFHWHSPAQ